MTNVPVATLGYGAMGLAGAYGPADERDSLAVLHHAVDQGVTFADTADLYGAGANERLVGHLLAQRRGEVTVATKFGIALTGAWPDGGMTTRGDAAYVRQACEASLRRLGVDSIDLYYLHRRQVSVPIEETVGAMAGLVAQGKVRHLGLSEVTADELRRAPRVHPIAAVQSEWSLWSRDVERAVVPAASELGVGFVPYAPLGRGFLTGTLTDRAAYRGDWRSGLPASRVTRSRRTGLPSAPCCASPPSSTRPRPRWRWPGCTPAARACACRWSRSPAPGAPPVSKRTSPRWPSASTAGQLRALDGIAAQVAGARSDNPDPDWVSDTLETAPAPRPGSNPKTIIPNGPWRLPRGT